MARARPKTFLTDELVIDFCRIVAAGNYRYTAAQRLGIPYHTIKGWMARAKKETEAYREGDEPSVFVHLYMTVQASEANMKIALVQDVATGSNDDKRWFLERRWNKEFTKNASVVLDDEEMEIQRVDPVALLADKLRELAALANGGDE